MVDRLDWCGDYEVSEKLKIRKIVKECGSKAMRK